MGLLNPPTNPHTKSFERRPLGPAHQLQGIHNSPRLPPSPPTPTLHIKMKIKQRVNYKTKRIEEQFEIKTNYTNYFEISNKLIKPEIFLTTDKYLGIPMYVSVKNSFLSFEHTHPPHEYILSENKFVKVANLKKEINEIIS